MSFMKKIIGWILLFLGLIIIFYALYSSYGIFSAKTQVPEIFSIVEKESVSAGTIEEVVQQQLKGVLPTESIVGLLNLIAWSIFAGILIFGGAQVASLGIKLIK
ncbi:MAG: hypothetical protein DRZ76_02170 [Candidatus Nealsonbacteria bacterium]|nr:MAG: hypothetical protein DRZ76_02170 [Candidatus Nealsonbacteria bacterium]